MSYCVYCGKQLEDGLASCPVCNCPNRGLSSVLNLSVVSLLVFFLGQFGAHRFYMQKYISAIFMFLTLGGLGFWTFGDIVWALSGKFKDKYGLPINASKDLGALPTALIAIFLIFVVLFLIGMLLAVFIPAYQNYADEQRSEDARIAAFLVSAAEEEYYDSHSSYTDDYNALTSGNYLDMDDAIIYGPIKLYSQSYGDGYRPCYSFKTSLKRAPEYASDYDSCKDYDYNAGDDYGAGGDEW